MDETFYRRSGKRLLDIGLTLLLALPAALIVAPAALAIRLGSPGPAILRQPRVGRNGAIFACYKLRTMFADTPHRASHEVSAASVTPTGRILRATKLDELPQLLNVLRGEMSFVGPRPSLPVQSELIAARRRTGALSMLPGITGAAQVQGVDMSDPERLAALDAAYLSRCSLSTDLALLWQTLTGQGRGDRVGADR